MFFAPERIFPFKGSTDMKCRAENRKKKIRNVEKCPSEVWCKNHVSLQAEKTDMSPFHAIFTTFRRAFLRITGKGRKWKCHASLTAEAAVVLPVFLLTAGSILGMMDIYRIQAQVKTSLHQSAQELGMYAYAAEKGQHTPAGVISDAVCAVYAKSRLPDLGEHVKIMTAGSSYRDGVIELTADITYRLPIRVVPLPSIRLKNGSSVRSWIGTSQTQQEENGSWEEMVYVTENPEVYHTSSSCTHIELAVHQGEKKEVERLRNAYGEKYHRCEKCGSASGNETVYYTEKGNRYHCSENCSGLKRTVRLVKKSEVPGLPQCTRCKEKEKP